MTEKTLAKILEEFVIDSKIAEKSANWGSPMCGRHGEYKLYNLLVPNYLKKEHQPVIIKEYKNGRPQGRYCIITRKENFDSDSKEKIIEKLWIYFINETLFI